MSPASRVRWAVRLYPRPWRDRYGDEFSALLADEIADKPRSLRRDLDVIGGAARAHLTNIGLGPPVSWAGDLANRGLAAVCVAAILFSTFALAIWSQLATSWRWSPPQTRATSGGSC